MESAHALEIQELLIYRDRLLTSLVELDEKVRKLILGDAPPVLDDMPQLLEVRDTLYDTQQRYEADVKALNIIIREALAHSPLPRYENATHVVQIMTPPPRKTIDAERLLLAGVAPQVIQGATKESPVAPFLRVDRRRVVGQ